MSFSGSQALPVDRAAAVDWIQAHGVSVLVISMPVQVGMYERQGPVVIAWIGVGLWLAGLFFEGVGDYQLVRFKADPSNRGTIMNRASGGLTNSLYAV